MTSITRSSHYSSFTSPFVVALVSLWVLTFSFAGDVDAKKKRRKRGPEQVFKGSILISNKPFPLKAKSVSKYIKKLKQLRKKRIVENKEKKQWKIYTAAFFSQPLNDLEITVKLYDVSSGKAVFLSAFEQYVSQRGQSSLISKMTLKREDIGVNKRIQIVMESKGRKLAIGSIQLVGDAEQHKGEVDFTEKQ